MEKSSFLLSPEEIDEFTGIKRGRTINPHTKFAQKIPKYELQVSHLQQIGIPFFIKYGGRPAVARSAIEGRKEEVKIQSGWQPKLAICR